PMASSHDFSTCKRVSERQSDGFYKNVTSRCLGISYRKSYTFHNVLKDDNGLLTARTLISYSAHKFILHSTKKQLAYYSMWMAIKEHAIVISLSSYNLTMSTTDYSIV
ncbi:11235_t:CDS:2, partial [Rhizophagus irregularis]